MFLFLFIYFTHLSYIYFLHFTFFFFFSFCIVWKLNFLEIHYFDLTVNIKLQTATRSYSEQQLCETVSDKKNNMYKLIIEFISFGCQPNHLKKLFCWILFWIWKNTILILLSLLESSLSLNISARSLSLIEPGPVHTEFEAKMIQDVKQKEYPGADPDTVHFFKNIYLPSSVDIFEALGQTPDDIARVKLLLFISATSLLIESVKVCTNIFPFLQCTKKVIEASRPRFRNLTNPLYTPIVALKYADETGGLSVHAFYHMLFNMGPLMHVSMTAMKYLTCGCLRRRTVSPN